MTTHASRSNEPSNEDSTPRPSQAEGSPTPEADDDQASIPTPSQAEGDRETIDEDLARQGKQ